MRPIWPTRPIKPTRPTRPMSLMRPLRSTRLMNLTRPLCPLKSTRLLWPTRLIWLTRSLQPTRPLWLMWPTKPMQPIRPLTIICIAVASGLFADCWLMMFLPLSITYHSPSQNILQSSQKWKDISEQLELVSDACAPSEFRIMKLATINLLVLFETLRFPSEFEIWINLTTLWKPRMEYFDVLKCSTINWDLLSRKGGMTLCWNDIISINLT